MGRPKLPPERGRSRFRQIRVTPAEDEWLVQIAEAGGQTVTEAILEAMEALARKRKVGRRPRVEG